MGGFMRNRIYKISARSAQGAKITAKRPLKLICLDSWFLALGSLFFIAVFVIDADEGAREGEDLAEGDEDRVVNLAQGWAEEARREHRAPEDAQCDSEYQLKIFHTYISAQTCAKTYPRRVLYLVWFLKPN